MARLEVIALGVCLLAACGGKVGSSGVRGSGGAQEGSGSARTGSGGVRSGVGGAQVGGSGGGTGGEQSGGTASGGVQNPPVCPPSVPSEGDPCAVDEVCWYVTTVKTCCEETAEASCAAGQWKVAETDCDCPESCPAGFTSCHDQCVDLSSNPDHCGACDLACAGPECLSCGICLTGPASVCSGGACSDLCTAGLVQCGASCVDLCTDFTNCGGCGQQCGPGAVCMKGECACDLSLVDCAGDCVDVAVDPGHCGACGEACAAGETCVDGVCQVPEWSACERHEDCLVTHASCCGICGGYGVDDVVALHRDFAATYRDAACASGAGCDPCAPTQLPSMTARCEVGRCEVDELTLDPITACAVDDDCVLQTQACCECEAPAEYLAIAKTELAAYFDLVCAEGQGCDLCAHEYPDWAHAACRAGHCFVEY